MKALASATLLVALLTAAGVVSSQSSSSRDAATGTGSAGSTAARNAPRAATGNSSGSNLGSSSAGVPDSTGGSRTPGTSASGEKADCPSAIARSADRNRGSSGTGSGYAIFKSPDRSVDDCASVSSGASSGSGSGETPHGSK
ncbi:hypothetical protein [Herbaspirillum sp. ST 5-3]|uniref:hypothetical protein n=1 Tax=Oxalobacteraceae TaxID=75682 RepID=UPI0010A446B6|nr:hypothetical protein [Herbaspirillum sp. ST 5-3]